jgi:hypothetical protein
VTNESGRREVPTLGVASTPKTAEQEVALEEITRQRRLIDQLSTMHSMLRDRYKLQGTALTCVVLVGSVVAIAFAFAGGSARVTILGLTANRSTWLGWFAVLTFSLTLVDLILDRRGAARRHGDAVRQLAAIKAEYRTPPSPGQEIAERDRRSERYQAVMDALPPIPERQFNRLKAWHLRKVAISRHLSANPGMSARQVRRALRQRA